MVTGDLTDWGTPPELESFREAAGSVAVPVLPMFGGHDGNRERFGDLSAERLAELKRNRQQEEIRRIVRRQEGVSFTRNYEEVLGPAWYSFDRGGRHFVLYPNEENFLSPRDRERKQAWLLADLAAQSAGREVVVFTHIPPPVAFLDLLSGSGARLVLHGHWHSSKLFVHGGMTIAGTPPIGVGGLDTRPRGYRLVDFGEGEPRIALRPLVRGGSPASREEPPITLEEGSGPLEVRWIHRLPAGLHRAAPVASDGRVLVSLAHEEDPGGSGVACVDGRSGERQWLTPADSAVKNSVAAGPGCCAALSVCGRLQLLETTSGRVRWAGRPARLPRALGLHLARDRRRRRVRRGTRAAAAPSTWIRARSGGTSSSTPATTARATRAPGSGGTSSSSSCRAEGYSPWIGARERWHGNGACTLSIPWPGPSWPATCW